MSKINAGNLIKKINDRTLAGANTKGEVALAMTAIVGAIPDVASIEGTSAEKAVSQKAWTDKNRTFVKNGRNYSVSIIAEGDSSLKLDDMSARLLGYSEVMLVGGNYVTLVAGKNILSFSENTQSPYYNQKQLATTDPASATRNGLMSIDQFKSVEDMITNFQGLVQSQADIKEAINDLSQRVGYSDDSWDSSLTLVSKSITGTPVRVAQAVGYTLGTGRVSKVIDKEGTFLIKGDDSRHFAPLTLDDQENVVQMYNKGATSVTLEYSGGTERFQRLSICSNTITRIHGNYAYVNELDVTRCTNLGTIQTGGNCYSTINLQYNLLLKSLSLGEALKLTTLDLRKNAAVTNLNLSRSILVASVNISGCIGLTTIDFNRCLALKYSGITFPATFRPKTMNISETAFTYADIISMVTNKWTYGEASSTIQVAQDMYDIIVAGDMAPFTIKNVNVVVI